MRRSPNLLGLFFTCKLLITKAITISDFSTGDASTPLFRPEFLTSWEHLAPCNNVRMLCYCTKMMVCWRGENWPSFLSRAAKNFSCSVKNYDLLIAAAATKVASTIPNSSGVIFLDMLFLLSYFWWGLSTKINKWRVQKLSLDLKTLESTFFWVRLYSTKNTQS